jgi:hypothetical protein
MSLWGKAKGVVKDVGGALGLSNPKVKAPTMTEDRFQVGAGREGHSAAAMTDRALGQSDQLYGQGGQMFGRSLAAQSRTDPTGVAKAAQLGRSSLGQYQRSRGQILRAANQQGPSQAQAQLQAGQDAAMRQQIAMARSGRGLAGEAAAMRGAAWNNAQLQSQTNQQAAQLRAQEQSDFLNRRMQALQSVGAQDAAMAQFGTQAGLQGQLQSQQMRDQYSLGLGQQALASQGLGQQAFSQGMNVLGMEQQGGIALETGQAQSSLQAQLANQQNQTARFGATMGAIGGVAGAAVAKSDERSKTKIRSLSTENAELRSALDAIAGVPNQVRGAQVEYPSAGARRPGRGLMGAGEVTASDLDAIGRQAIDTIRQAPGYSYEYKEPGSDGAAPGRHAGPMAQDLERTPLGRSLVREAPDGTKMVDSTRAGMTALAAASEQQRELDELRRKVAAIGGERAPMPTPRTPAWLTGAPR